MSSPVHHPKDIDPPLMYAPPRVRKTGVKGQTAADRRPVASPPTSPDLEDFEPVFIGDRAMLALQRQLSLDPEIVPEPPAPFRRGPPVEKMALRLCIVACVAALGAWAATWLTSKPTGDEITRSAPAPAPLVTPVKLVDASAPPSPPLPAASQVAIPAPAPTPSDAPATQNESQLGPRLAALPPQQPDAPPAAANTSQVSPDEIAMLLQRGKTDLRDGDISAARLLLRRAAEAGNAEAALELGSTFDPLVIERLGALGVQADPAKAREWYQRAAALGSNAAARELARLAHDAE